MPLDPGLRLGAYEILAPIGAGGMGEVYRARDSRLAREVAIKILPTAVAGSADLLARFEREARAVAALSHPNILTIHDFGRSDGITYAVMELLDGESLRSRLAAGPLPPRKAIEVAAQIARGLAAAHDKGIVHRDLKPENVFLTRGSTVKILDFGLARLLRPASSPLSGADSPTVAPATERGTVLGTVGYMAPEQIRGESTDGRADIFALGCVLYEMLAGRRAFARDTAAETMAAILKEDPPEPPTLHLDTGPALLRTLRRCLEKRPDERYQSAHDLAFALDSAIEGRNSGSQALPVGRSRRLSWVSALSLVAGVVLGLGIAAVVARTGTDSSDATVAPIFRRLTFDNGTVWDARFTPDGQSVVYGAAWDGQPVRVFMTRPDSMESVRLPLPDARLLSISKTGEMAISLGHRFDGWMGEGTLARSSVLGSAPRPILEHIREAEWHPNGDDLAIVRRQGAFEQLEYPAGHVLYRTSGYISHVRFSPSGQHLAFADHPLYADDAGAVSIVDLAGTRSVLSEGWISVRSLSWSPDGSEIWFTATRGGPEGGGDGLLAVTRNGQVRVVLAGPARVRLYDIAADGRVLLGMERRERRVDALLRGWSEARDVSVRQNSVAHWVAADGSTLVISDQSTPKYDAYVLRADSNAPVRLGEGQALSMSDDLSWAAALPVTGAPVILHPAGPGQSRPLPNPDSLLINAVGWLGSRHLVLFGQKRNARTRGYVQAIDGGSPTPFTPEGVNAPAWWALPIARDGRVAGRNEEGAIEIYHVDGRPPAAVAGLRPDEVPLRWTADQQDLLVSHGGGAPRFVDRLDPRTGRRTRVLEITARDSAGLRLSVMAISPDAQYYVHTYARLLTDLFIVEGLR